MGWYNFYKLPKQFHPDFSRPGVKPTGNVEIDWSNPLARHLVRAYAPAQGFFDFVAGVLTANSGVTQQRAVTEFAGTTGNKVSYNSSIDSHTELTVIAKVRRDRYTGIYNGGIYSEKNVGNWSGTQGISINFRQNRTSGLLFKVGSTDLLIDEDYAPVGEFNTLVFSWRASSYQRIYVNGSLRASAASPAASFTKSTVAGRMGVYYDESASRTLDGAIDYLYILNKALSASEIASLSRDPYQILKPAQPMMLFINDVVSGEPTVYDVNVNYNVMNTMLNSCIGNLNTTISQGLTSAYLGFGGTTYEVTTSFNTSSGINNGSNRSIYSNIDFSTLSSYLSSSLATMQTNIHANVNSRIISDPNAVISGNMVFSTAYGYVATVSGFGIEALANYATSFALGAFGNTNTTAEASNSLVSALLSHVQSNENTAININVGNQFSTVGGSDLDSSCSFSITSSDSTISYISIEAIADYGVALGLLCSATAQIEGSIDVNVLSSVVASTVSIVQAQSNFSTTNSFSTTSTLTTNAGVTITVTSGFTSDGIQFTSTEVITPDARMVKVLAENRQIKISSENRIISVTK